MNDLSKKVVSKLEENGAYYDVYCSTFENCKDIIIHIEWGDWKHDHGWLKRFMLSEFNARCLGSTITEEDGSDCYSADHYFTFDQNIVNDMISHEIFCG